jgi:hypothetical protein
MRAAAVILVVVAALAMTASPQARSQEAIWIANFPDVQQVTGSVSIEGPIPAARLDRFADIVVTSVRPTDTNRLVAAGTLDAAGFTTMALSLAIEVKGTVPKDCRVGALLVPDEDLVNSAFSEGHILFPTEIGVDVRAEAPQFVSSEPEVVPVAFPRYRVYLFNTGSRTVKATVWAMLRNP